MIKRRLADPSRIYRGTFRTIQDKNVLETYSREKSHPEVPSFSGRDSVIRINSTSMELVDRQYHWRGMITLASSGFFGLFFIACFFWPLLKYLFLGAYPQANMVLLSIIWLVFILPLSWASGKIMISEVFASTHYPIRLKRKNKMVYVCQGHNQLLAVP